MRREPLEPLEPMEPSQVEAERAALQRHVGEMLHQEGMGNDTLLCKLKGDMSQQVLSAWSQDAASKAFFNHKLHTCAVVSNSGVLGLHSHGPVIDKADLVVRLNDAPLQSWSQLVGKKDDVRVVNEQFPGRILSNTLASYVFNQSTLFGLLPFKPPNGLDKVRSMYPTTTIEVLPESLLESFSQTLQSIYNPSWFTGHSVSYLATTGAIGMLSALTVCDEVWAFGFAETPSSTSSPYHYYPNEFGAQAASKETSSWHKTFPAEKDFWRRIARNPDSEIDATDMAVITGFSQMQCS